MMKKTNSWMRTKVLYFIPAVAISFCAIACSDSSESDNTNEVYEKVEIMPEYPGGMESMMNFMKSSMKYPEIAEKNGATGKAIISFVVEKDGKVWLNSDDPYAWFVVDSLTIGNAGAKRLPTGKILLFSEESLFSRILLQGESR